MKKKFWMSLGMTAVALISLSACSAKNSDTAKKAFISDTLALNNSKEYNSQDLKIDVNQLEFQGKDSSELNKSLKQGLHLDLTASLDKSNQLASLSTKFNFDKKDYKLDFMMSKTGLYLDSSDVKNLYNSSKSLIPSSLSQLTSIYGAMIDSLNKPYLLIDSKTIDSMAQSTDDNWESTFNQIFEQNQKISQADLEKEFKKIPNSAFTKEGDKTLLNISGKDVDLEELINSISSTSSIPKKQLDSLIKESKDIDISKLNLKLVIDKKARQMTGLISGKISDTKEKTSTNLNLSISSTRSKLKESLKEPDAAAANTIAELQNAAIAKLTASLSV